MWSQAQSMTMYSRSMVAHLNFTQHSVPATAIALAACHSSADCLDIINAPSPVGRPGGADGRAAVHIGGGHVFLRSLLLGGKLGRL